MENSFINKDVVDLITSLTSLTAIAISVYTLTKDKKRHGIDIMLSLNDKFFNSLEFEVKRKNVLDFILNNKVYKPDAKLNHDVKGQVLDFFQSVGYLTRLKSIEKGYVINHFGYWLVIYWEFFKPYIEEDRDFDNTCWDDYEWLYKKTINSKEYKNRSLDTNLEYFISYEINNLKSI